MKLNLKICDTVRQPLGEALVLRGVELSSDPDALALCDADYQGGALRWGGVSPLPRAFVETMFPSNALSPSVHSKLFASKFVDTSKGWNSQTLFGIRLQGLMNSNIGADVEVGCATRFVRSEKLDELFTNPLLCSHLESQKFVGFLTLGLTPEVDVTSVSFSLPPYAWFALVEGCDEEIGEFFSNPLRSRVRESWVVSQLLSRFPFPAANTYMGISISPPLDDARRHFHPFVPLGVHTTSTRIAVVSAWGLTLQEASRRVGRTLDAFPLLEKQYRTDVSRAVELEFAQVAQLLS
jgi:hypothetical protein